MFYGAGTAVLHEEIWRLFHENKLRFDLVILDHTYGSDSTQVDHLNARQFVEHISRFRNEGLLAENARFFATHISHAGNPVHSELVKFALSNGYEIEYDGLILNCPPGKDIRSLLASSTLIASSAPFMV